MSNKKGAKNISSQPVVRLIPIQIEGLDTGKDNKSTNDKTNENIAASSLESIGSSSDFESFPNMEKKDEINETKEVIIDSSNKTEQDILNDKESEDVELKEIDRMDVEVSTKLRPPYNVPEKIVIVYDQAQDEDYTSFECNGKKYQPSYMMKSALKFYLLNKFNLGNSHEFALMVLNDSSVTWVHDFTRDIQSILRLLDEAKECETEDRFDLTPIFDAVNKNVDMCIPQENRIVPPLYTVRVILLYGRSYTIPFLRETPEVKELLSSTYFTFDVCMTHEKPSSSNNSDKIFQILQKIDKKGMSYAFSVHRSPTQLHEAMAKLLAHPLQRPYQKSARYNIILKDEIC